MNKANISKTLSIILFLLVIINMAISWMANSLLFSAYSTPGVIDIGHQILYLVGQSMLFLTVSTIFLGFILIPMSTIILMIELWKFIKKQNYSKIILICSIIILVIAVIHLVTNSIIYPILLNISSFDSSDFMLMIYNLEIPISIKNFIDTIVFIVSLPTALIMLIVAMRTIESRELDD